MADSKVTDLTSAGTLDGTEVLYAVKDPSGTPLDRKTTAGAIKTLSIGAGSVSIASGKTFTSSNTLTLAGTDGTTMTFPSTSATLARTDAGNTFTGAQTFSVGTVNGTGLDVTQTWTGTGTYTGLKYNVTDSGPANAASLLLDIGTGGGSYVSKFSVKKDGTTTIGSGATQMALSPQPYYLGIGGDGTWFNVSSGNIWFGGVWLRSAGTGSLQLGNADAATTAVAQTLQVQSNTGAANGPDFTIKGSNSGAANTGGNINFQLADAGTYSTQLYLRTDKVAIFGSSTSSAFNVQVRQSTSGIQVSNSGGGLTARMTGDRTGSSGGARIHVGSNAEIGWNDATTLTSSAFDTILTRGGAAATLQLGAADTTGTTAPTAQFLRVQSWSSSTNNDQTGANFTIQGSRGTGAGAGGSIIFQVAPAGSAGTGAQNAYATALTIGSTKELFFANILFSPSSDSNTGNMSIGGVIGAQMRRYVGDFNSAFVFTGIGLASSLSSGGTSPDVLICRDAANTLALRNGTNAQKFRVYNTYTSSTNYEDFEIDWQTTANIALVGPTKGSGGGTQRVQRLQYLEDGGTGSTTPSLGTTCPAASATIKSWIKVITSDGTTAYIPCWA